MFYRVDFHCDDREDVQSTLNDLYGYRHDIATKVLHRNRMNLFSRLMEEFIEKGLIGSFDAAIDIGCNAGAYSKIISDFGFRYVLGIDIAEEQIRRASEKFALGENERVLEFSVQDAESLDAERKYDFVLCTEVIEHTPHPETVVDVIRTILAPGGIALLSLPNRLSLPYMGALLFHRLKRRKPGSSLEQHLQYPFYRSIKMLRDEHLRIIKTSGSNLIFNSVILRGLYQRPLFAAINRLNFRLSRAWPWKYISQFFFVVLKNESPAHGHLKA